MAFGDRINMGDGTGMNLECGHPDMKPGDTCTVCGVVVPEPQMDCKHIGERYGQTCWHCGTYWRFVTTMEEDKKP